MEYLRVKNWEEFQHYKDRNPPWIKLHRSLLDNYDFCALEDIQKAHLMLIWIQASQNDGTIPKDAKFLERKLSCSGLDLEALIVAGFLIPDASNALAACKQVATRSVRLEEKRREEKNYEAFEQFWAIYPKKKNKGKAEQAFFKVNPDSDLLQTILKAVEGAACGADWRKNDGQFIPYPATWLNAKGWLDGDSARGKEPWEL